MPKLCLILKTFTLHRTWMNKMKGSIDQECMDAISGIIRKPFNYYEELNIIKAWVITL